MSITKQEREVTQMFTYHFIDNLGLATPADFAFDSDMEYLKSRVVSGEYKELVIVKRFF